MTSNSVETNLKKIAIQRKAFFCLSLFCFLLFFACDADRTYFHQYKNVNTDGWMADDTIVFHITPSSQNQLLSAEIGVRTTDAFKYNTLFLLGTLSREGMEISTDTIFVNIYGRRGEVKGKGLIYPLCTQSLPSFEVDSAMEYTYTVRPFMKPKIVEGVKDVGLKLRIDRGD